MVSMMKGFYTEVLSNQGERSLNFYFIMVPLRKQVLKYGTPKPSEFHRGFKWQLESEAGTPELLGAVWV